MRELQRGMKARRLDGVDGNWRMKDRGGLDGTKWERKWWGNGLVVTKWCRAPFVAVGMEQRGSTASEMLGHSSTHWDLRRICRVLLLLFGRFVIECLMREAIDENLVIPEIS